MLVACATRYGSRLEVAEEVAEEVARVLPQSGLLVDDLSVREVKSLNGYRAVVVGATLSAAVGRESADGGRQQIS